MLQAYMDDSGTHDDSYACVVAGYFGGVRRWKEFEIKWGSILDEYAVSEFHASRFWKRSPDGLGVGEYRGWPTTRLDEFLNRLLQVIERTRVYPFASGVLRSEWQGLTIEDKKIFTGGRPRNLANASTNLIYLPFQYCVIRAASYCKATMRIHFVFDEDKATKPWAGICYKQLKGEAVADKDERFDWQFGDLIFADSRLALPLQAADLLAYEAARYCRQAQGSPAHPVNHVYGRALKNMKSREDFWLFDRARLGVLLGMKNRTTKKQKEKK